MFKKINIFYQKYKQYMFNFISWFLIALVLWLFANHIYEQEILPIVYKSPIDKLQTTIYYLQLFLGVLLWFVATYLAIKQMGINEEQLSLAKWQAILTDKQLQLTSVWNKINWLNSELAVAHQKYDNLVNLHKEAESSWDIYASWEIKKMIVNMQEALRNLSIARNKAFDINDKIVEEIKQEKQNRY